MPQEFSTSIPKPVVLTILDGWGIALPGPGNAVTLAKTPTFDTLWRSFPHTQLLASGEAVGLPSGEAGNSEVGHMNLGAGYIVYQDLMRISRSIADGSFFKKEAFLQALNHVKKNKSNLHLMGLIGPAGVHSFTDHLFALLRLCKDNGLGSQVFVHAFTDGRDAPPTSTMVYLGEVHQKMQSLGVGKLATIVGRYYGMDRDLRWQRTKKAYDLLTLGVGKKYTSFLRAISDSYKEGITDEFVTPVVLVDKDNMPQGLIFDHDAVIFFNFRTDRPRQLTHAFVMPEFEEFKREVHPKDLFFVTMTEYEDALPVSGVAFPPHDVDLPLARVLSERNLRQLHLAESEKFPHVTYFFNGGREDPFPEEDRIEVPSPKIATYDLKPEMSASAVTEILIERIESGLYDFILVNFANPDMVGHTGVLEAGIKAAETVDGCLLKIVPEVQAKSGVMFVTADHGNLEVMIDPETGSTDTEHNKSPVPFIFVGATPEPREIPSGILADIAPTVLGLLKIPKPSSMTARDLLG